MSLINSCTDTRASYVLTEQRGILHLEKSEMRSIVKPFYLPPCSWWMLKNCNRGIVYTYSLWHHRIAIQQACNQTTNGGRMAENCNGGYVGWACTADPNEDHLGQNFQWAYHSSRMSEWLDVSAYMHPLHHIIFILLVRQFVAIWWGRFAYWGMTIRCFLKFRQTNRHINNHFSLLMDAHNSMLRFSY